MLVLPPHVYAYNGIIIVVGFGAVVMVLIGCWLISLIMKEYLKLVEGCNNYVQFGLV